jgi:hypothetical protein
MKRIILSISSLIMFVGCATTPIQSTSTSYADDILKKDVLAQIKTVENSCTLLGQKGIPAMGMPEVVYYTPTVIPKTSTDSWEEIWSIQRKGYVVKYKITFTPTPSQGGCDIKASALFSASDYK